MLKIKSTCPENEATLKNATTKEKKLFGEIKHIIWHGVAWN